jgi:hypothetical protein
MLEMLEMLAHMIGCSAKWRGEKVKFEPLAESSFTRTFSLLAEKARMPSSIDGAHAGSGPIGNAPTPLGKTVPRISISGPAGSSTPPVSTPEPIRTFSEEFGGHHFRGFEDAAGLGSVDDLPERAHNRFSVILGGSRSPHGDGSLLDSSSPSAAPGHTRGPRRRTTNTNTSVTASMPSLQLPSVS